MRARVDTSDFASFADRLDSLPERIRSEIGTGLRTAAIPLGAAMVKAGVAAYPHRGGLSSRLANTDVDVDRVAITASDVKVTIELRQAQGYYLDALDDGTLRHPVFGRPPWVRQPVRPRAYSDAFLAGETVVVAGLKRHLDDALRSMGA